jgi:nondiscriminating aspartyl-tRNA synthetase
MRTLVRDIPGQVGQEVTIQGWLHKKRLLGGLNFIVVRDRSGVVQSIVKDESEIEKLRGMQIGTVLSVIGSVKDEPRAPGGVELHEPKIEVLVPVTDELPIEIDKPLDHKSENLDTLFDNRVLGLRNLREQVIFKVQAKVLEAARLYFTQHDFMEMNTPKLLAEATEGGAEVFKLDYFGKTATLAQSAQFYKQIMVGVFERVFETNPTYRAEPSATTRHMTEYITIDAEMSFIEFDELLTFTGGLLHYIVEQVWAAYEDDLKQWDASRPLLPEQIPLLPMREVHELYTKAKGIDTTQEDDLRPDEEKWICEYTAKNMGSEAVFVTEWPVSSMKFYHRKNADNPELADRSDLLFRGVEIATVPMREHRYPILVDQLKSIAKGDPEHPGFKPYLSAFRHGLPPHGGFGLGLERTVEKLIGLGNIKEATLFPRDMNRLSP